MPAVTTKFTSDDTLDLEMFSTNINAQLDAGVSAIILGGSLGEASTLSNEEKEQLVKHTVESCQGRVPVVMNIAERATKQAVTLAENAQKWGAEGLMLLPPMQYKATDYEVMA
ncbi:MAG: dihydrodipicolinate synthase family protein, partial [Cyanobacteria bacterium J06649_11]